MGLNLHTHLEGWVRPETAADLARSMGVPEPAGGWDAALRMRSPADLTVFLAHVAAAYPVLGSAGSLRRVAREAVEDAAADGCDYLEIRFGPATHVRPGFDVGAVIAATAEGLDDGRQATGMPAGLVVCLLRHDDAETNLGGRPRGGGGGRQGRGRSRRGRRRARPPLDGAVRRAVPDRGRGRAGADGTRRRGGPGRVGPRGRRRRWAWPGSVTGRVPATTRRCSRGPRTTASRSRSVRPRTS